MPCILSRYALCSHPSEPPALTKRFGMQVKMERCIKQFPFLLCLRTRFCHIPLLPISPHLATIGTSWQSFSFVSSFSLVWFSLVWLYPLFRILSTVIVVHKIFTITALDLLSTIKFLAIIFTILALPSPNISATGLAVLIDVIWTTPSQCVDIVFIIRMVVAFSHLTKSLHVFVRSAL